MNNQQGVCIKCGTSYWGRLCDNCYPSPVPEMKAQIDQFAARVIHGGSLCTNCLVSRTMHESGICGECYIKRVRTGIENRSFTLEEIAAMESGAQG